VSPPSSEPTATRSASPSAAISRIIPTCTTASLMGILKRVY
jgi:hypothetical protein